MLKWIRNYMLQKLHQKQQDVIKLRWQKEQLQQKLNQAKSENTINK